MKKILSTTFLFVFLVSLSHCSAQSRVPKIQGEINVTSSLANKVSPTDVLYIYVFESRPASNSSESQAQAESQKSPGPKPIVVLKMAPVIFPVKYTLSKNDVIFPEKKLEGPLEIQARLEHSDPGSNKKRIFVGNYPKNPVYLGTSRINFLLDKELKDVQ